MPALKRDKRKRTGWSKITKHIWRHIWKTPNIWSNIFVWRPYTTPRPCPSFHATWSYSSESAGSGPEVRSRECHRPCYGSRSSTRIDAPAVPDHHPPSRRRSLTCRWWSCRGRPGRWTSKIVRKVWRSTRSPEPECCSENNNMKSGKRKVS